MRTSVANEGDWIAIPLSDEEWAIAKVVFVSERYKDVMLLAVCPGVVEQPGGSFQPDEEPIYDQLIYTGRKGFQKRKWRVLGNSPVLASEKDMTERIVAGNVWRGDDFLRPASPDDEQTLQQMDVAGHIRVEHLLRKRYEA